jgi:hypothetical protein
MFLDKLVDELNTTTTENGAKTLISSKNALVDFFALAGAMRSRPEEAVRLFQAAYNQDKLIATRLLFYMRDIRGGQGERELFRNCLVQVVDKKVFAKVAKHIPEYGRWDDLMTCVPAVISLPIIQSQLAEDIKSDTPSLMAKWMPSINTSSALTRQKARILAKALGMSEAQYRKTVAGIRKKIKLLEQDMSAKNWDKIQYDKIPSQAGLKHKKAFYRNDEKRYISFLESVKKGEKTMNAGTIYPYQLYDRASEPGSDELWEQLPDYTRGKNAMVVADVSGSMSGQPMSVSVSLALYFAERNKGAFHNYFMTFSEKPQLVKVQGDTLRARLHAIKRSDWGMNTDLFKVFQTLVGTAIANNIRASEFPETLYIISDMQFDECVDGLTNMEAIDELFREYEYPRPNVVFWNVNARNTEVPVDQNEYGVTLVSGFSPSVFKMGVENKTPYELMMDIAYSERYAIIEL